MKKIKNLYSGIMIKVKYLNDNGVTVIRMGRVVKKKMNYKNIFAIINFYY